MPLRRPLSEWGIPAGLACMVVAFAAGSASMQSIKHVGLHVRWAVLAAVCVLAVVKAFRRLRRERGVPSRGLLRFGALAGSFLAVAAVSTAWSVSPRLSFERAGSLGILFVLAAALAVSTADDVRARVRLFQGLAAGAAAVGALGVLVLLANYDAAAQQATATSPWRYRGFTENPNTIAILAAVALPIILGLALRTPSRRRQAMWLAAAVLMLGSLVGAESRGGLLAACAGTLVVAAFGVEGLRRRAVAVTALLLVFGGGTALRQVVQPPPPTFSSVVAPAPTAPRVQHTATSVTSKRRGSSGHRAGSQRSTGSNGRGSNSTGSYTGGATPQGKHKAHAHRRKKHRPFIQVAVTPVALPPEQDEIGHPALSKTAASTVASGRLAAWKGALELVRDRPILGYGFGTEAKVFVDRWYYFQGDTPENSYLGVLLQLGAIGLALIAAMGLALVVGTVRALRALRGDERVLALAALGVLVAGAGIMLIQSYLYSVGNIASATVWISLFVLAPSALEPRRAAARVGATAREAAT